MAHPCTGYKLDGDKNVMIVNIYSVCKVMCRVSNMTIMATAVLLLLMVTIPACLAGHAWNYDLKVSRVVILS